MSKTYKDKPKNDQKLKPSSENDLFTEKIKAAYSQMGKLGGMARAKQMAERGFQPKSIIAIDKKVDKSSPKKASKSQGSNKL